MNEEAKERLIRQVQRLKSIDANQWTDQQFAEAKAVSAEIKQLKRQDDRAALNDQIRSLGVPSEIAGQPAHSRGLWGALASQGFDVKSHPVAIVAASEALGVKAAAFDGTIGDDTIPTVVESPALGADSRFLYPRFPLVAVEPDVANVSTYRQKSRSLADPDDMVRAIDAVSDKPVTDTTAEVVPLPLKQVATVCESIPLILFSSATFQQWIRSDVELAWRYAIDKRVVDEILDADTAVIDGSPDNIYEEILYARAAVAAAGYQPNIAVVSPGDALAIELLQMTGGDSYAFRQDLPQLVVTPSVDDGDGFVADTSAAGTLYSSPTRFETFVEDPRKNTYIARYESNAEFAVNRGDAICLLGGGS